MSAVVLAACVAVTFVAGMLQRLTGIGYGLVATPILILTVGTDEAVKLVVVTGMMCSALAFWDTRAECRPWQIFPLVPFALVAIWPAALLSTNASASLASLVVLVALAIAMHPRGIAVKSMWGEAAFAGSLSGAMNTVAALGGPMAATYGIAQRWGASMVPNLQLFLVTTSLGVLCVRGWPATTNSASLALLAAAAVMGQQSPVVSRDLSTRVTPAI